MSHLCDVNAEELGEVIDMIKDLEQAMYYHSIVKAMAESEEATYYYDRDMDKMLHGKMYYTEP
jgi:hypothetical protein